MAELRMQNVELSLSSRELEVIRKALQFSIEENMKSTSYDDSLMSQILEDTEG